MQFFNLKKTAKGFTLIELLVVIAIIGILASVVLAALGSARMKGRNTARIQMVQEYAKALELVRARTGDYPAADSPATTGYFCLGDYDDDACWSNGNTYPESTLLITALDPYIKNPPGDTVSIYEGLIYRKPTGNVTVLNSSGNSTVGKFQYEIRYMLEGVGATCVGDMKAANPDSGGRTYCSYVPR